MEIKENHAEKPAFDKIFPMSHTGIMMIEKITEIITISGHPMPNMKKIFRKTKTFFLYTI